MKGLPGGLNDPVPDQLPSIELFYDPASERVRHEHLLHRLADCVVSDTVQRGSGHPAAALVRTVQVLHQRRDGPLVADVFECPDGRDPDAPVPVPGRDHQGFDRGRANPLQRDRGAPPRLPVHRAEQRRDREDGPVPVPADRLGRVKHLIRGAVDKRMHQRSDRGLLLHLSSHPVDLLLSTGRASPVWIIDICSTTLPGNVAGQTEKVGVSSRCRSASRRPGWAAAWSRSGTGEGASSAWSRWGRWSSGAW